MERNDFTEEEAEARIGSQLSLSEKRDKADHVIDNTGEFTLTGQCQFGARAGVVIWGAPAAKVKFAQFFKFWAFVLSPSPPRATPFYALLFTSFIIVTFFRVTNKRLGTSSERGNTADTEYCCVSDLTYPCDSYICLLSF